LGEKRTLWQEAASASDGEKLLLAGVSMDGVHEALRAIECARGLGYTRAVVEPPQYPRPWVEDPRTQAAFFRAVADQAEMPLLIANPKPESGVRLSAETLLSLSHHPAISGVIESGDEETIQKLVKEAPSRFAVLCGEDTLLYACLAAGARGAVPALANAAPFFCLSIEEAVRTRDLPSAAELQQRALSAAKAVTAEHGVAGLKCAMDLRGYYGGNPRLPLLPVASGVKERITAALAGINS
jgi:4-hydroxy-2-oxoglutarate aldolase